MNAKQNSKAKQEKAQLNVRLPKKVVDRFKNEVDRCHMKQERILAVIIENFWTAYPDAGKRESFYLKGV